MKHVTKHIIRTNPGPSIKHNSIKKKNEIEEVKETVIEEIVVEKPKSPRGKKKNQEVVVMEETPVEETPENNNEDIEN